MLPYNLLEGFKLILKLIKFRLIPKFQWKAYLGRMLVVESKAVPSYFWATENTEGRDGRGILEVDGHVFRVSFPTTPPRKSKIFVGTAQRSRF